MAQYTSMLDVLPTLIEINHANRAAKAEADKSRAELDLQALTQSKDYNPNAKLDFFDGLLPFDTKAKRSVQINKTIDGIYESLYGKSQFVEPNYTTDGYNTASKIHDKAYDIFTDPATELAKLLGINNAPPVEHNEQQEASPSEAYKQIRQQLGLDNRK